MVDNWQGFIDNWQRTWLSFIFYKTHFKAFWLHCSTLFVRKCVTFYRDDSHTVLLVLSFELRPSILEVLLLIQLNGWTMVWTFVLRRVTQDLRNGQGRRSPTPKSFRREMVLLVVKTLNVIRVCSQLWLFTHVNDRKGIVLNKNYHLFACNTWESISH